MRTEEIIRLVETFGEEFSGEILPNLPDSQYGNLESMILYAIIRDRKFRIVVEMGTEARGRSTYIIQKALLKNGGVFLHIMNDLPGIVEEAFANLVRQGMGGNIWLLSGPAQTMMDIFRPNLGKVDFMFIDADHSADFARWYVTEVINYLPKGSTVHIHDINITKEQDRGFSEDNEEIALRQLMEKGHLPLESIFSLDNFGRFSKYENSWNRLKEKFSFIGEHPATGFPYLCSAQYFLKKGDK